MGALSPEGGRATRVRAALVASVVALSAAAGPARVSAQVEANPILHGTALLGDTALTSGTVVLHHLTTTTQGEVDSITVAADGSFSLRLPNVPDPARGDVFFASIRHEGVSYFGSFVTTASQLDSVYSIQTYDTLLAPEQGVDLQIEIRTVFLEAVENRWRVTDVFQLANMGTRTVVTRETGAVWRYPLAVGATEFAVGEGDMTPEVIDLEDGDLVLRAPMSPGPRMFVVRYMLDDMFTSIPTPGIVDQFEVLIREPAPLMEVEGLSFLARVELEVGSTYRRYSGQSVDLASIRLVSIDAPFEPPVEWVAVVLGTLLAGMGLFALRASGLSFSREPSGAPASSRHGLLLQVARLDDDFEAQGNPSASARTTYERRREGLLSRIRAAP
ncbi:MAG: hypothetical protein VX956_15160 [Gemmatimonadota bacterium]|nr:hypothetical protein [Gemmatimonadota bacterium]